MRHQELEGKTVLLSDILEELEERLDGMQHGLLGSHGDSDQVLRERLGRVQGFQLAIKLILSTYGASRL